MAVSGEAVLADGACVAGADEGCLVLTGLAGGGAVALFGERLVALGRGTPTQHITHITEIFHVFGKSWMNGFQSTFTRNNLTSTRRTFEHHTIYKVTTIYTTCYIYTCYSSCMML